MTPPPALRAASLVEAKLVMDALDRHTLAAIGLGQEPGDGTVAAAEAAYDGLVLAIQQLADAQLTAGRAGATTADAPDPGLFEGAL